MNIPQVYYSAICLINCCVSCNYETYGDRAIAEIQLTQQLIKQIEQLMQSQGG